MSPYSWTRPAWRCMAAAALCSAGMAHAAGKLNDTGQRQCIKLGQISSECAGTRQDAEFGRDVAYNQDADGKAGFSFVKIAFDGSELSPTAEQWSCVQDKLTGLMWEAKTNDGGLRDYNRTYVNNGSDGPNSVFVYVGSVNAQGLCGHSDWRMPTRQELMGLVDFGVAAAPPIDTSWFVHNAVRWWTSSRVDRWPGNAWMLYADGQNATFADWNTAGVRLVRAAQVAVAAGADGAPNHIAARYEPKGDKVKDKLTGLLWKRCSEGQTWDGVQCLGTPRGYTWLEAAALAKSGAANAWRVPNSKELASLVPDDHLEPGGNCDVGWYPAIDRTAFPNTACSDYWTATFSGQANWTPNLSYAVRFGLDGALVLAQRGVRYPVRLVRGAP